MRRCKIGRAIGGIALTDAVPRVDESNKKTANFVTQRWPFCETLRDENLSCCTLAAATRPQFKLRYSRDAISNIRIKIVPWLRCVDFECYSFVGCNIPSKPLGPDLGGFACGRICDLKAASHSAACWFCIFR